MTRAEYLALKPGQCIKQKRGARKYRIVIKPPCAKRGLDGRHDSGVTCLGLYKIGHSWTGPHKDRPGNLTAWHDAHVIMRDYIVTERQGMSQRLANWIYAHRSDDKKERSR